MAGPKNHGFSHATTQETLTNDPEPGCQPDADREEVGQARDRRAFCRHESDRGQTARTQSASRNPLASPNGSADRDQETITATENVERSVPYY